MLVKIMKYEFKSSGRILWPFFGLSVALALVIRLALLLVPYIWEPLGNIFKTLASSFGVLLLLAVVILAFVLVVVRFYQSMASNEAYLTFTLPASTNSHILARVIVSSIYSFLSVLVAILCGIIFVPGFFENVVIRSPHSPVPASFWVQIVFITAGFLLLSVVNTLLQFFAAIAIGTQFGRSRVVGSVVGYFILSTASSFLSLLFMALPMFSFLHDQNKFTHTIYSIKTLGDFAGFMGYLLALTAILSLIVSAIYYAITWYCFTKKLNLE